MAQENRYIWLDLLRGLSAFAVCAGHLRAAMFADYASLPNKGIFAKAFYFVTGLGHQAVVVFFVLSGFFVGGSVLKQGAHFSWGSYLAARLSRLWAVLLPALLFTLALDILLQSIDPLVLAGAYRNELSSGPSTDYSASFLTFLGNVAFLQTIYTPMYGSNGPLWSLANEFWYYILFPLCMIFLGHIRSSTKEKALSLLCLALLGGFVARNLLEGFLIWLFGTAVFVLYQHRFFFQKSWITAACFLLLLGSLVESKVLFIQRKVHLPADITVGIFFSLFLLSIHQKEPFLFLKKGITRVAEWTAKISYSMYLFHFPVILLIYALFYAKKQTSFHPWGLAQYSFWLLFLTMGGYLFWWLFERQTPALRRLFSKWLAPSPKV